MGTISTVSLKTPTAKPPLKTVPDIWAKYFAGRHAEVLDECNTALFAGHAPDYLHVHGLSLMAQGRIGEAMLSLKTALALHPHAPSWYANASIAALNAKAPQEALGFAVEGLARHDDAMLRFALGNAQMAFNRLADAQSAYEGALALAPALMPARLNLGNVLRRLGRSAEALALYNGVVNVEPDNGVAQINRASLLIELNQPDEAALVLLRIMATVDMPEVNLLMAMLRLMDGDLIAGFDLYRSRFDCAAGAADKAAFRKPLIASLDQAAGRHVLLVHEQGYGDTIQFIRYLPALANRAARVTLLVPPALVRLLRSIDDRVQVISARDETIGHDLECPMLHLPFLFKTTVDAVPASLPYLGVSQDEIERLRLPPLRGRARRRVGLVWAGQLREHSDLAAVDRRRALSYREFEPLFDVTAVDFVSLQWGDAERQINDGTKGKRRPLRVLDASMDFLDTAAVIKQLDLVITVDTAVAHLAGALGKPVWVLSRVDACWRWLRQRDDSPWYPGVLRLFQQTTPNDWTDTVIAIRTALIEWTKLA